MSRLRTQGNGRAPFALFRLVLVAWVAALLPLAAAQAGPFDDLGYAATEMNGWITAVDEVIRGPQNIALPAGPASSAGSPTNVIGSATGAVGNTISLGDGGSITVFLEGGIHNGPRDDFAVFENGFTDLPGLFAELAFVEVSSNGLDYARFEVDALNANPVAGFGFLDPSDYFGLAGRHEAFFGTGFDLADLAFDPLVESGSLDLMDVRYVRVIDVVGDGSRVDRSGNPIFDPYPTDFAEGGFDLEAIGIIHVTGAVPEPSTALGLAFGVMGLLSFRSLRARRASRRSFALACLFFATVANPAHALTSTFEDLGLGSEDFENGANLPGGFASGGIFYENSYFPSFDGFVGFAASTTTDNTTPGFFNQFSNIAGGGAGGSSGFGIFFPAGKIVLPSVQTVLGAQFTNTTFAALSMRDGDAFAKQFGGVTGDDADFFRLIVEGLDASGASTGTVELMLADYTFANNALDFILTDWVHLDLTGLGAVKELSFEFESSDIGAFGINTPMYFAIDDLVTIPEPGTTLLLGWGLGLLANRRSGQRNASC